MLDDTKRRILVHAGEIFADKGFEAASVREICQAAHVNLAAINYHFGDKRKLYVAAVREAQCCQMDAVPFPDWPPEMPAVERFRLFIRMMLERMLDRDRPKWHLELMLRELARPTEACEAVVEDYIRPMASALRSILDDLLPATMPEDQRWRIGFSVVGQILFYYVHRPIVRLLIGPDADRHLTLDLLEEQITRFSLAALGYALPFVPGHAIPQSASDRPTGQSLSQGVDR